MPNNAYNDPNRYYLLDEMLKIGAPPAPDDFHIFWHAAYRKVLNLRPEVHLKDTHERVNNWRVIDVYYESTNDITIGGWLLVPVDKAPTRVLIVGHGYAGRRVPDFDLPFPDAAIFFPCCRGLGRSRVAPFSSDPQWHVLHDIDKREEYVIRGCVEDTWLAVTAMEVVFPYLRGKVGYLGLSFTGGIGALAMACEERVEKAHFNVPTFGHHLLRLKYATWGSGHAVQTFYHTHPEMALDTLRYYDAATAAESIQMPVHYALALKDPVVTPPGQFAIYNNTNSKKQLFVFDEGHSHYPRQHEQGQQLLVELEEFFADL